MKTGSRPKERYRESSASSFNGVSLSETPTVAPKVFRSYLLGIEKSRKWSPSSKFFNIHPLLALNCCVTFVVYGTKIPKHEGTQGHTGLLASNVVPTRGPLGFLGLGFRALNPKP